MKRIGIAASKIAKDDLVLYNFYVLVLSGLVSLLIFLLSAFVLIAGTALVVYLTRGTPLFDPSVGISKIFVICIAALSVVVAGFNLVAILVNVKLRK